MILYHGSNVIVQEPQILENYIRRTNMLLILYRKMSGCV